MSDLADTIDDLICSFESDGKTMDTLIMYLFCWALVGFAALAIGKFAYARAMGYAAGRKTPATAGKATATGTSEPSDDGRKNTQSAAAPGHRAVPPTPPVSRKRLGSKSGRTSAAVAGIAAGLSAVPAAAAANRAFSPEQQQVHHNHPPRPPPVATGNDPDAVRWTNDVLGWLYSRLSTGGDPSVAEYLFGEWIAALNEYTKKSFAEKNNQCDMADAKFNNLKCCKKELEANQLKICDAVKGKKKLETRLLNTSSFLEDTIKNHEMAQSQYTENYNALWSKYQNKKKELENVNNLKDHLNVKIDEMNKMIRKLSCSLKQHDENNKYLETENFKLKEHANEDKNYICHLENDIKNRVELSEKIVDELNATAQKLEEKNREVKKEKEENRKLKCKIECIQNEMLKKVEQSKILELQLTKDKDMLKTEIQIQKTRITELNKILCEQKSERQELTATLEKSNEKIDLLKQTLEKVKVQTQQQIDELRKEKSNVEKEKEELDHETEKQMEEFKKMENENKQLRTQMDDLQYKFEMIIKKSEEKQKLSTEQIEKINCDTKKLMIEMNSKNQTIKELEEKLSKVEKTHKTEIENFHSFKKELDNLKQKQTIMPSKYNLNTDYDQSSDHVNRVLDDLRLDRKLCMEYDDTSSRNVRSQNLEEVLTKCNSIINYCTK